ncbi:hypothetical protein GCM10022198_24180 [Klugiella xanthotipulae]|uniref:Uncharacterized protein n=1 Tax=Klugiella xanthotipulae TaxID=244735 RepID=A0A543I6A5_9MICO|nr:hypothetical protein [Klugiella xanthotipulae]TQM66133.1 hypothetical protein FB466_0961 [Klugiella xanthotipulae]
MTERTHIRQLDGVSRGPLIDTVRPYPDQIRYSLNRLDGSSAWSYSLWRTPEGADLLEDIPLSETYMQCAGAAAAMTVEVRLETSEGVFRQYVVGKPLNEHAEAPTEVISWGQREQDRTQVYSNEVFTADEAAEVFYDYFLTDKVSGLYVLRELEL